MSYCMTILKVQRYQKADNKQTLLAIVNNLYEEFIVKEGHKWVMVEGDAKTYDILQCIKTEYREEMAWLFVFPGDWHILKITRKY